MQFSVRRLFGVTGIVAVVCAAYVHAGIATEALVLLHVALMSAAVLCLIAGPGRRRPFCVGFLLCGVIYPCFPGPSIPRAVAARHETSMAEGAVVSGVVGILLMLAAGYASFRAFRERQR